MYRLVLFVLISAATIQTGCNQKNAVKKLPSYAFLTQDSAYVQVDSRKKNREQIDTIQGVVYERQVNIAKGEIVSKITSLDSRIISSGKYILSGGIESANFSFFDFESGDVRTECYDYYIAMRHGIWQITYPNGKTESIEYTSGKVLN